MMSNFFRRFFNTTPDSGLYEPCAPALSERLFDGKPIAIKHLFLNGRSMSHRMTNFTARL